MKCPKNQKVSSYILHNQLYNFKLNFIFSSIKNTYIFIKSLQDPLDLSEALLSLGFGKYTEPSSKLILNDPYWKKYYKFLSQVEGDAKNERLGLWSQR